MKPSTWAVLAFMAAALLFAGYQSTRAVVLLAAALESCAGK